MDKKLPRIASLHFPLSLAAVTLTLYQGPLAGGLDIIATFGLFAPYIICNVLIGWSCWDAGQLEAPDW